MRREHPIKRKRRRQKYVDGLIVAIFFILALSLVFHRMWERREDRSALLRQRALYLMNDPTYATRDLAIGTPVLPRQGSSSQGGEESLAPNDERAESPRARGDIGGEKRGSTTGGSPVLESGEMTPEYPQYSEVTVTRYIDDRLGFIMELPEGWNLVNQDGSSALFSPSSRSYGETVGTLHGRSGALWMSIARPCSALSATTTIWSFVDIDKDVRAAEACVPPFHIRLAYRADVPDFLARERFLLSLGRTVYPLVSPTAPYAPLRP